MRVISICFKFSELTMFHLTELTRDKSAQSVAALVAYEVAQVQLFDIKTICKARVKLEVYACLHALAHAITRTRIFTPHDTRGGAGAALIKLEVCSHTSTNIRTQMQKKLHPEFLYTTRTYTYQKSKPSVFTNIIRAYHVLSTPWG